MARLGGLWMLGVAALLSATPAESAERRTVAILREADESAARR